MNFFIKNLAAADLCVGLISVLTDIIWKITISWEAGVVVCKLIRYTVLDISLGCLPGSSEKRLTGNRGKLTFQPSCWLQMALPGWCLVSLLFL